MDPSALDAVFSPGETRNVEIKAAYGLQVDVCSHRSTSMGAMANTPSTLITPLLVRTLCPQKVVEYRDHDRAEQRRDDAHTLQREIKP